MTEVDACQAIAAGSGYAWTGLSYEDACPVSRHCVVRFVAARGVPVPGGTVRKLVDPDRVVLVVPLGVVGA